MNPFKVFNTEEISKMNKIVGDLENRDYTNEELNVMESNILSDIMSKSSKNGDMSKERNEFDSIINKIEENIG